MNLPRPSLAAYLLNAFLAAGAYFLAGSYWVEQGAPSADEGFYLYASSAVWHGAVPYRDFGYTQTPLLPYVPGAVFSAGGYGVRGQRWLNVAWVAAAAGLSAILLTAAGAPLPWRVLLLLCWCLCKPLVYWSSVGKTYGFCELLMIGAALCLQGSFLLPDRGAKGRRLALLAVLSMLCVLAVGCRLTAAPSAGLLWLGYALVDRGRTPPTLLVGIPVLFALLCIGPFYALDPRNAAFWTWTYHHLNQAHFSRTGLLMDSARAAMAPAALGLAGAALVIARLARPGAGDPAPVRHGPLWRPGTWVLAAGLAGWVIPVALSGVYSEYAIPSVPLVIVGFGLLVSRPGAPAGRPGAPALAAYAATAIALGVGFAGGGDLVLPGYLDAVDQTATVVRRETRPDDPVLTSMPEIAVASGRPVFPRLELGKFGLTGEMDPVLARARHVLPFQELLDAVNAEACPVVVLFTKDLKWNFTWSIPSFRVIPPASTAQLQQALATHYRQIDANEFFAVYRRRS